VAKILPTQVVEAIDSLFGPNRNELDGRGCRNAIREAEIFALWKIRV
jgi:hypothetical protein